MTVNSQKEHEMGNEITSVMTSVIARCKNCQWSRVSDNSPDCILSVNGVHKAARDHAVRYGHKVKTKEICTVVKE